ncbi:MAG: glycoside hydrolase family 127 protein [Lachnospiraceae bacterium]|jgi:hypothetical protein|nr:glycoside hydrolase family 127 protein [Lachnospiraceae bacterium]
MRNRKIKKWFALALALCMTAGSLNSYQVQAAPEVPKTARLQTDSAAAENYLNNQGELKENPFIQLPLGAVRAESWLENQLLLMKNGITGNMKYFHDYNDQGSAWLGSTGPGANTWENGPYFIRGLTALAYALNDQDLINETLQWLEWAVGSQQDSGYFGPANDDSWWSRMPMLCAIRDFYEAVEQKPALERSEREVTLQGKILDFFERYFRYQAEELPRRPLSNWADARGGDNLEIVYWLYNQIYEEAHPERTAWLLDLGELIYRQTNNWEDIYNNSTVRTHVVNTSQGMKTPAVYSQYKDGEQYRSALSNGLDHMSIDHGRIDGLPNSDEAARENRSTRGSETCGTVEGLLSTEIAMRIQGEAWMGDRLELLAYNALPAAYPSDYSGHAYYILQNQVMNTLGNHEFDCDHGDSSAFGAPLGFDCCFANNHMGWAKFVQNMWMAKANGGLALAAYGPNRVTAKVADGKTAKFVQKTDYPFRDTVNLEYCGDTAAFDLDLRIPEWAKDAQVTVNGESLKGVKTGAFYTVNRTWKSGDKVCVVFKSEIELTTWYNNSTAVQKGALIYGLKIEEDWRTYEENDARELKVEHKEELPLREVYPASPWNYGLVTDENASFELKETDEVALQPFASDSAPVEIIANGVALPEWTLDGNIAGPQPFGPIDYSAEEMQKITLVPYGCQRLRITHFPTMNNEADTEAVVRTEGSLITRNGITYQDFDNIVVPKAQNYKLKVKAEGSGTVIINSKYRQEVTGDFEIAGLKNLLSGGFQFKDGQYNNIRFTGDIRVKEVKVEFLNREITEISVVNAIRNGSTGKILTNLDAQETPYKVLYGTEPGIYTKTVRGFSSGTATLQGLEKEKNYYAKVVATICGEEMESREIVLEVSEDQGGLKPNPNVPAASYEGFSTLNYMTGPDGLWNALGGAVVQAQAHENTTRASEIRFGTSEGQKAVLDAQGALNWVDYVAEADLTLDEVKGNNAGIMFRCTDIGEGPDAYHGYYAGVGMANGKPGVMIGYADGGWHDLQVIPKDDIQAGVKYTIKAVVYSNMFAIYLNEELVAVIRDDKFSLGTVGLRSYKVPFTGHDMRVRPVTEEDLKVFESLVPDEPEEMVPHKSHQVTEYTGFAATEDGTKSHFQFYDPQQKINEAFSVYDFTIQNIAQEDLTVFEENQEEEPAIVPDFADTFDSDANWTKVGDTALIGVSDGQMQLGRSNNVKAVAGNEGWSDMVCTADITLKEGDGNAGLLVRTTREGSGADNYYGYYFGINGAGYEIGKSSNTWKQLETGALKLDTSVSHQLQVTAYKDKLLFSVDGEAITLIQDSDHAKGKIGLRGYGRSFVADQVQVRGLTDEDKEAIVKLEELKKQMEITGYSANDSIQVKFPRISNATSYRILFGEESGVYTNEFTEIYFNGYKGSGIFTHDKAAFSTLKPGRWYVKVLAMNGNTEVAYSNEIAVDTGERESAEMEYKKFAAVLAKAEGLDDNSFTPVSKKRLARAKDYASKVNAYTEANQIEFATAADLLSIAMNTPDSEEFTQTDEPGGVTEEELKEALARAEAAWKAAEELRDQAVKAKDQAKALAREAQAAKQAALEAQKKAEDLANASETEKIEAQKKAEEAAKAAELAGQKAEKAQQAVKTALEAQRRAEEAADLAGKEVEALRGECDSAREELEREKEAAQKAKEEAEASQKAAVESAKRAEKALQDLEELLKKNKTQKDEEKVKAGNIVTDGKLKYRILNTGKRTAAVVGAKNKSIKSVKVSALVTVEGVKYRVTEVASKAFQNCKKLTGVTLGSNIEKIGSKAFYKDRKLSRITIKSGKLKKVGKYCLKGINGKTVIDVPNKKERAYRKLLKKGKAGQPRSVTIK